MVRLRLVQRAMERATETNIIFLHACRDNPLARNLARAMGTRSVSIGRGLAEVASGVGTLISFSTQPGNVALDGNGRNSPFATALLKHLTTTDDDLSSLLIGVRNDVMAETANQQVPWEHSALRARLYLRPGRGPRPGHGPAATPLDARHQEAMQSWAVVRDSKSAAMLRLFAERYNGTFWGDLAAARIRELARKPADQNRAGATDWTTTTAQPAPSGRAAFDGDWLVNLASNGQCPDKSWIFTIQIRDGKIRSGRRGFQGSIQTDGTITFRHPSKYKASRFVIYEGRIQGSDGPMALKVQNRSCAGSGTIKRLEVAGAN